MTTSTLNMVGVQVAATLIIASIAIAVRYSIRGSLSGSTALSDRPVPRSRAAALYWGTYLAPLLLAAVAYTGWLVATGHLHHRQLTMLGIALAAFPLGLIMPFRAEGMMVPLIGAIPFLIYIGLFVLLMAQPHSRVLRLVLVSLVTLLVLNISGCVYGMSKMEFPLSP